MNTLIQIKPESTNGWDLNMKSANVEIRSWRLKHQNEETELMNFLPEFGVWYRGLRGIQMEFSRRNSSNPEEEECMAMAKAEKGSCSADLVLATDPDADRVGVAVKNNTGKFELLNGNQIGSLLIYYVLSAKKEQNKLSGTAYIVKTIVPQSSGGFAHKKNTFFGVKHYETLTGFNIS
ncbi:hypothetical protein FQR65_LT19605 [Abscondita terminalis]|nr:hypothetical protein FQR65_LT19605 [Abscondita terminalis]